MKFIKTSSFDKNIPHPENIRWLKAKIKPNEKTTPEEVQNMVNSVDFLRDKTIIAVCFEAGLRVSELLTLDVKDVSFDDYRAKIKVRGKTGERIVGLKGYKLSDVTKALLFFRFSFSQT